MISTMTPSRSLCLFFLFIFSSLLQASDESSEADVKEWLNRMVDAVHSKNYVGTFVYLHDNQLETLKVIHSITEAGEHERLVSLNGEAREVIRDQASITCISPDNRSVSIDNRMAGSSFRSVFSMDSEQLSRLYAFQMLGKARIADREAVAIAILPRDQLRYGYRIFIEKQHGLPLKTDMLGPSGEMISQIMFTHLDVVSDNTGLQQQNRMQEVPGGEHFAWKTQPMTSYTAMDKPGEWLLTDLPEGFEITVVANRQGGSGQPEVKHLVLSDGLATLSVYIESDSDGMPFQGASQLGTVNAFGQQADGYLITAVGEVPAETVRQVATAVRINSNLATR